MRGARRKVALLSERADFFGGGQRSLLEMAVGLAGAGGVRPLVVVPGPGPLTEALERAGVEIAVVPLPPLRRVFSAAVALQRLTALLRRRGCDLVHTQSPRQALYGGMAARLLGIPHLFHARSSRPARYPVEALLAALCDGVVAVSRAAAGRSAALRRPALAQVIPTGIPRPACFDAGPARAALGLPRGVPIAGVVGRVEPDKGSETAIAALPSLRRHVPDVLLAFLGPCDPASRWAQLLRLRAATLGVADAVRFLGDWPEAARFLKSFDVLLHPSRHEALPRVLIEAAFCGVPAVAASVGGVGEVIEDGRTGILVPQDDPAALGDAAGRLLADPARLLALGRRAASEAPERFGFDAMLRRLVSLYDAVQDRRTRPSRTREVIP